LKKIILKILLWVNLVAAIFLIVSYISVYIPSDRIWFASVFGLLYPVFLWVNILFCIFWILFKPKYLWVSLIVVLIGWGFLTKYVQVDSKHTETIGIKLLSYNVKHFEVNGEGAAKTTADSVIALLKRKAPDIICLQEVRLRTNSIFNLPQLVNEFDFVEHYQYARTAYYGGIVTMTKYPIVNMGEIRFQNSGNMAIFTDVVIDTDTIRIFNVHLQSFQIDPNNYSIIESPDITKETDFRQMKEMGFKFKRASKMRAEQARIINGNINWSPYPVIICGDFNDTPFSYTYRKVRGNLNDAFIESGSGFGQTYIGKLPSYRIDYFLYSDFFEAFNFKPENVHFSDHLPISCTLIKR
jgi:endonuclease/exonuclease/phosphatase family metal-dependent hydrolase